MTWRRHERRVREEKVTWMKMRMRMLTAAEAMVEMLR
jgi:hypothetical protein